MKLRIFLTIIAGGALICAQVWAMTGEFDVGGGANHFPTIIAAVDSLRADGLTGPVTFNVYPGTYDGQVNISHDIAGMGPNNPLVIRGAPGLAMPVVTNVSGTGYTEGMGFFLTSVQYVTIEGFEISQIDYAGIKVYRVTGGDSSRHCTIRGNYVHNFLSTMQNFGVAVFHSVDCEVYDNITDGGYTGLYIFVATRCKTYNNMSMNARSNGIRCMYGGSNEFYYNSVYLAGPCACENSFSENNIFKDNILYNGGSAYSNKVYYVNGESTAASMVSDYNDLYAPNGASVVRWLNVYHSTLAAYQSVSGLDSNSLSDEPCFISNMGDLHIDTQQNSPVDNMGVPIPGISVDIDGDTRDPIHPDIGADEFTSGNPNLLNLTMTPLNPPILIPGNGGSFGYDLEISYLGGNPLVADGWVYAVLPNGFNYYTIIRPGLSIPPAGTISRRLTQSVPGQAPAGNYLYVASLGTYPNVVTVSDTFLFVKSAGECSFSGDRGWELLGWDDGTDIAEVPASHLMLTVNPNPFNARIVARFELRDASRIKLSVFDITGREVAVLAEGYYSAGTHRVVFEGRGLASGVYLARMDVGKTNNTKKLILMK